jgi:hypothetical protein
MGSRKKAAVGLVDSKTVIQTAATPLFGVELFSGSRAANEIL